MFVFSPPNQRTQVGAADTVIGAGTHMHGRLTSEGTVLVLGSVDGEVTSAGTIVIEETGRVSATLTAEEVLVAGQVEGQLHGTGRVELRPTARLRGEIHTHSLVIQEGAVFDGRVRIAEAGGGPPTPQSAAALPSNTLVSALPPRASPPGQQFNE